ncbi:protein NLRC3-like isoform X1 [Lates japonicus]|uniref:Protein NLRC3-like isoform X1 n=1 Tax=Lates japonicus TaxID=270547 RepID=A0AAD3M3Y6_LATJO|nr:protein NLRC3-like isoform X1 [Lates japonicus]
MDDTEMEAMATPSGSSSLGEAVSGRGGQSVPEDDEDDRLYYIPERRPSLDLGPSPMDTSHWHYVEQALPPALSYTSLETEESSVEMDDEDRSSTRVQLDRTDSYSSCYSLDSDDCEKRIPKVKTKDDIVSEPSETPELIQNPNEIRHPSLTVAFTFKAICNTLGKLSEMDVRRFKGMLWKRYPQSFTTSPQGMDMVDLVDRLLECFSLEVSMQITKTLLEEMGQKKMVDYLQTLCIRNEVRHDLSETLRRKYCEVCEEERKPFDDVFTKLYITSTCDNGPNIEHEVMKIEKLDSNREPGKLLSTHDILSAERLEHSNIKLILITGVAGSGKSMAVRRLIIDWIEERSHKHVAFLFPLPFRELKQFEGSKVSLLEIIHKLYPETKKLREEDYRCEDCKMMFVFDGLDEYNGKLDFENTELLGDHRDPTTLNVIVVNLLRGRLLYRGLFLVFSRPQVKRAPDHSPDKERDFLMKLGKLAFTMLEKGQFKMTKSDWKETGISDEEAVINSGLCTQYVTKPYVLFHEKVLSFIHPTMQEYLAALYAFLSFRNQGKNIFEQQLKDKVRGMFKGHKAMELYKSAVDRSLLYEDGKLDLFLRFLFGMTLKSNLELLQPFCTSSVKWPAVIEDTIALIRKRIRENQYPARNDNLQCCLVELGVLASQAMSF